MPAVYTGSHVGAYKYAQCVKRVKRALEYQANIIHKFIRILMITDKKLI